MGELTDVVDPRCGHLEVYDWANLLTRWMRQLAEPLVPNDDRYDAAVDLGREQLKDGFWGAISDAQVRKAQDVLDSLPVLPKPGAKHRPLPHLARLLAGEWAAPRLDRSID